MSGSSKEDEINRIKTNMGLNLNLKATELRLGLPGSQSPARKPEVVGKNSWASGAKRGFSDLAANGALCGVQSDSVPSPAASRKDVVLRSPEPVVPGKKPQGGGGANGNGFVAPSDKALVVGWPPIPASRKNTMASNAPKSGGDAQGKLGSCCLYVKVSMDGAPYLRKVDLKNYGSYVQLSSALEKMFSCFTIGQCGSHGDSTRDKLSENCLTDLLHCSEYVLTYEDKDGDWMLVGDVPWDMFTDSCRRLRIMNRTNAVGLASCSPKYHRGESQKP